MQGLIFSISELLFGKHQLTHFTFWEIYDE